MMIALLLSLTACTTIVGDFCDVYTRVDMAGADAAKLERKYQERILINELLFEECRRKKSPRFLGVGNSVK